MTSMTAGATIMVIDDSQSNLDLLTGALSDRGFGVRAFTDGEQAVAAAVASPPDLVLLDIRMPGMDGYEVCKRLRSAMRTRDVPVVFLSALTEPINKDRAFEFGAVDFLTRPFRLEELSARVETHLRLRRVMVELERHNVHLEKQVRARTKQLQDAHERLKVLDGAKSDFLSLISHELRTPLGGIVGYAELVFERFSSDPEVQWMRARFETSRRRMLRILDDACLLTEIQLTQPESHGESVPLGAVIVSAIETTREFALSRDVTVSAAPVCKVRVLGIESLLVRAVGALIETAVKFALPRTSVALDCRSTSGSVTVDLTASGRSVPDDVVPRFFDVLSVSRPITPGGDLGLAPALAARIVAIFGGAVSVLNSPGHDGIVLQVRLETP